MDLEAMIGSICSRFYLKAKTKDAFSIFQVIGYYYDLKNGRGRKSTLSPIGEYYEYN